jgi:hypothetical protein
MFRWRKALDIYGAMPILVDGARDMRRDQHPPIGPEPRHGRVLEFTDVDIEHSASYVTAAKRIDEGFLVDDLAPATLMSTLPAFFAVKWSLSKRRVVSGVHRQQITTESLSGRNRWRSPGLPSSLNPGGKGKPG